MTSKHNDSHDLKAFAKEIRKAALRMVHKAKSSHLGGALSMTDLLAVLYGKALRIDPSHPTAEDRDRLILSKGHACSSLYAALAERGFFPKDWLDEYCTNGGKLAGHATHNNVPGVELSTGSLGHGLSVACGLALAAKRDCKSHRVFVILGDGECDEGSTWEAALFARHHKLDNLTTIVDYNNLQGLGTTDEVLTLEPFAEKGVSFGWAVNEIDGHNIDEICKSLNVLPFQTGRPSCVVARTTKGKGASFMENRLSWHYKSPNDEEYSIALSEIEEKNEKRFS